MDGVGFISQFVKDAYAGHLDNNRSLAETSRNVIGAPTNFPNYGDFAETLLMKTYGFDISGSPWQDNYVPQDDRNSRYNYIDLEFDEAVYPFKVSIYEVYNPGSVIQISAQDSNNKWFQLWNGSSQNVPPTSRLFSPPLSHPCNFKTKMIRLKFMSGVLKYSSRIDAVQLTGTSKLRNDDTLDRHLSDTLFSSCERLKEINSVNHQDDFKQLCNISVLPDEIILEILKNLDMRSLSHIYAVDKRLRKITRDHSLFKFKCLNLRNIQYKNSAHVHNIISFFAPTSKYLTQLDLTSSRISTNHLLRLMKKFGRFLTHLRLRDCDSVNKHILFKISRMCKNLRVLDLAACRGVLTDKGLSCVKHLKNLEHLDLRMTYITEKSVCKILQKTPRMRVLLLPGVTEDLDADAITMQLRNSCPDLEILDISGGIITSRNIDDLCECKNLRKLYFLQMNYRLIDSPLIAQLFYSCERLEEIAMVNHHDDFNELTLCKEVRELYLRQLSSPAIVEQHPKLKVIYVMHHNCDFFAEIQEKHVSIYSLVSGERLN